MTPTVATHPTLDRVSAQPGSPVVVLPADAVGEPCLGELTVFSATDLITTSRVRLEGESVSALTGRRVFARIRAEQALVVVQGLARPVAGSAEEIELVGVTGLAVESRRRAVRADLAYEVLLRPEQVAADLTRVLGNATTVRTLDLSAGGCRIVLPLSVSLAPEQRLALTITAPSGLVWHLTGEVVRVDTEAGDAALRFVDISEADADRIDQDVLSWHSLRHG